MKPALVLLCLLLPAVVRAGNVTLAWDAVAGADIDFYTLNYGRYGQLEGQSVSVSATAINPDATSYQVTLSLPDGMLFEATVTSTNFFGIASLPSSVVVFQSDGTGNVVAPAASPASFFAGEVYLGNGVSYLAFPNGNVFGYYARLSDARFVYHFDLGFEYVVDALDGAGGVYFYDFASSTFFYTSPGFGFPYLYDFSLNAVLYYYPDPNNSGRYNTDGTRYFYNFSNGRIITK